MCTFISILVRNFINALLKLILSITIIAYSYKIPEEVKNRHETLRRPSFQEQVVK